MVISHPHSDGLASGTDLALALSETHSAVLLFAGDRVYKVKKALDLGFLDHRDRAARLETCQREVELNRRLAPDVYLGVADVIGPDGALCDHMVVMRRMPADRSLSRCLAVGEDVEDALRQVAHAVAALHSRAVVVGADCGPASLDSVRRNWDESFQQLEAFAGDTVDPGVCERIEQLVGRYLAGRAELFAERIADGRVVDGHGDLLADDIYLLPDGPRVLDCLEFDDRFRIGDAVADIAFLAMDLERLGRPELGRRFVEQYREMASGSWPPSLLEHYIAYRAHVRAKVEALRALQGAPETEAMTGLLSMALSHLERARVRLMLVGGLPGTGKSTIANALGDLTGAIVLRTDEVRHQLDSAGRRYDPETVRAVYRLMLDEAEQLLERGHHVVLDATWNDAAARTDARSVAARTTSDLTEIRCTAPREVALNRIGRRLAMGDDPSEATPQVAIDMESRFGPWPEATTLETSGPLPTTIAVAGGVIGWPAADPDD